MLKISQSVLDKLRRKKTRREREMNPFQIGNQKLKDEIAEFATGKLQFKKKDWQSVVRIEGPSSITYSAPLIEQRKGQTFREYIL